MIGVGQLPPPDGRLEMRPAAEQHPLGLARILERSISGLRLERPCAHSRRSSASLLQGPKRLLPVAVAHTCLHHT